MKLTKQYLRYVPGSTFGIIGAGKSIQILTKVNQNKFVAVPACEKVLIWDPRKKSKILTLQHENVTSAVTTLSCCPCPVSKINGENTYLAVGYADGSVVLYDTRFGQPILFQGHKSGISTISWDHEGMRISSGSEDGEIIIWDVVSERGIVKFRGHKGRINKLTFLKSKNVLVSCAKDTFIKFWDLGSNHCFCTLTKHHTDVSDFVVIKNDSRLIIGGSGPALSVWSLDFIKDLPERSENSIVSEANIEHEEPSFKVKVTDSLDKFANEPQINRAEEDENDLSDENPYIKARRLGEIMRTKSDRVLGIYTNERTIAVHGKSNAVDLFTIFTDEESKAKYERRLKRSRKRARENNTDLPSEYLELSLSDEIRFVDSLKTDSKLNALAISSISKHNLRIACLHVDNSLTVYEGIFDEKAKSVEVVQETGLFLPGHRNEVRVCRFNSTAEQLITASSEAIKVWKKGEREGEVIKTIECDYPLSMILLPGGKHVVIGTKSGRIQLFELVSGALLEDFQAHDRNESNESGVWAMDIFHREDGFVSGGSDCLVKFWKIDIVPDTEIKGQKRLVISRDKRGALKVADQITSCKLSKDGQYLAVAHFDLKETIYYADSLKLIHELYGKPMPSTCMDFSTDSTLIVTGSKDSCIRIYDTDLGQQKRFIKNCHQGGVTDIEFIKNTHMFFSCGNDGSLKQYDADNFQRIITIKQHIGIVRCLSIAGKGDTVVTCGQDRSIRFYNRTNEPLVLSDQREEERAQEEDEGVMQEAVVDGERNAQAVRPTKISKDTEKAADQLFEALEIYKEQKQKDAQPNNLMSLVYKTNDPLKFVLLVLRRIKSSELEECILVLPLHMILVLLFCVKGIIERDWDVELACRVMVVAVRINLPQLVASKQAAPILRSLTDLMPKKTQSFQDMIGFNLAGLRHMQNREEERSETQLFVEAASKVKEKRKKKKKMERIAQRAILTL